MSFLHCPHTCLLLAGKLKGGKSGTCLLYFGLVTRDMAPLPIAPPLAGARAIGRFAMNLHDPQGTEANL